MTKWLRILVFDPAVYAGERGFPFSLTERGCRIQYSKVINWNHLIPSNRFEHSVHCNVSSDRETQIWIPCRTRRHSRKKKENSSPPAEQAKSCVDTLHIEKKSNENNVITWTKTCLDRSKEKENGLRDTYHDEHGRKKKEETTITYK